MSDLTHLTPEKSWRAPFLEALRTHGVVSEAAKVANVSRWTAYHERATDSAFAKEWEEALALGVEALEDTAKMRAYAGSDTLLIFLLKAHRPAVYRETTRNINTNVQVDWNTVPPDLRDAFIDGKITLDDVLRSLQPND